MKPGCLPKVWTMAKGIFHSGICWSNWHNQLATPRFHDLSTPFWRFWWAGCRFCGKGLGLFGCQAWLWYLMVEGKHFLFLMGRIGISRRISGHSSSFCLSKGCRVLFYLRYQPPICRIGEYWLMSDNLTRPPPKSVQLTSVGGPCLKIDTGTQCIFNQWSWALNGDVDDVYLPVPGLEQDEAPLGGEAMVTYTVIFGHIYRGIVTNPFRDDLVNRGELWVLSIST